MKNRLLTLPSLRDEEEEEEKKTLSGLDRLNAASGKTEEPAKKEESAAPEQQLSGMDRLNAAREKQNAEPQSAAPQVSTNYREVDKEKGRIRTRSSDMNVASWQDDPEKLGAEAKGKSSAVQLTQNALGMAGAAMEAAKAKKQAAEDNVSLYAQSIQKYQGILADESASIEDKWTARKNLEALKPIYSNLQTSARQASQAYDQAESTYNAGKLRLNALQDSLQQTTDRYVKALGLGEAKAKEYDKQAQSLRSEADKQYRSGQANYQALRQAEDLEAKAANSRGQYASYLYLTEGEEAANRYAAGEREKGETASFWEKVVNTIAGLGANFFSGIGGASMIMMSRLMELPDDALYAITKNEAFNLDREPYLRDSKALEASDPFRETANELKERAGSLGGKIIDTGYAAGSMMGVGGLTGQVTGALANTGLMTKLTSIAESSPLLTSPAARRGAQMAVNALRNPGNLGVSLSSGVNSYSEALASGASFSQAMANGLWKGLTEYVSNKMFSGTPLEDIPGEKGYVTKAIEFVADKLGKSDVLRALNQKTGGKVLNWLFDKAGEGMEEVITGVFDPIIDRLTYDTEAEWAPKLDALTDEFIGGVLLSLLMTGGEAAMTGAVNLSTDRKIADYLVENWGIEQAEARKYAPQIRKALKATQDATEAVRQEETPAQQTTLARIVQKVTKGETLTGQDARKILADPEAMQALMDGGYLGGKVSNDSEGRNKIVAAAEQYAEDNATQATDNATLGIDNAIARADNATQGPPVPEQGLRLPTAEEKAPVQESKLRLKGAEENAPPAAQRESGLRLPAAENAPPVPNSVPTAENYAQIGAENAQNPEKPLSGIERLNAARDESKLRLPTEAKLTLKGSDNNGQTETTRNAGKIVLGGSGERGSGPRAGEQAEQVGRSPEGWRTLSRPEKAAARRAYADDVGVQPVQAKSLGVTAAAEDSTVRVYPREAWEPDLQRIAGKVEKATGKRVTYVLGAMKVNADGVALTVRGVNTGKGIIVQADDPSISAEKIATHEAFHAFAAQDPELSAQVLKQIRKNYPENRLREIAGTYLDKLYGIVDLDSTDRSVLSKALERVREEICADAYAGINAFAANADEYTGAARQAVTEARREAAAATERRTGPPQEQYSADEEYIPESAAEYGQLKRQGKYKAPKIAKPVSKSTATIAKADLRKALLTAYSIPGGSRGEIGKMIDALADQYLKNKRISWNDREDLINKLWESGVMHMEADDGFQAVRELVNRGRIYVPERIKNEFGDDWNSFRREALGEGIYLVNDESAAGWDQWNAELSDAFPGLFPEDEYDPRSFLERVVDLARKGKGENLTLAEYAAKTGGVEYATAEDMMDNLERQADYALKAFAEKANLEIYLKDRTGVKITQERQRMGELMDKAVARERQRGDKRVQAAKESGANALAKEKQREEDRRKKEREHRKEVAQRLRERQAMRELQQKTLKQLQWLSRNQNKFPAEAKKQVQDLLEDMDVLAVSTAEEMHIDNATGKTWKDLREMYLEAKEKDPNWLPSAQLEKIVMRLDAKKIGDLDMGALQDLYKAAIGMRTELYNRNNLINDELHRTLDEVYESAKTEIQEAKGGFKAGLAQRYADMQLTPMNRFLKMAGWNPDSTWYGMAKGLEAGERAQRKFKTESQRQIAPVLEQYRDWMKTADGQGKNAKWYEIKVPESWEYHMGDKPIFSDKTVTVYMTPAQKVHMYLESKNLDNLRHMEGGRTFADKELYSKRKRAEAFANGTTVKLLPETVKSIVSDLTAEEQALANALEQYYNNFSKQEINKVSNILYGYDKAMGGYYAPIFTNDNYTKSDPGVFDLTAEGVGNLKERQHAANPSWNISAFDAFERSVDRTGKFVGLAIPIRNMNTLWNWRESGNSMKDVVSHKWNKPGVDFVSDLMTELQSGRDITHPKIEQLTNAALSKYIGATFGFNPSIVLKQFASFPLAGTYLGYDNLIKGILRPAADTDLISKYTGELDYRLLGYATPETATLKNNPNKLQEKGPLNFMFGGGAITWMDGLTVRTLWNGAEQKIKSEQPDLEAGTQEQIAAGQSPFYQAVAKEFEEAVSRSQPMYDTMHRADIMREGDPITRTFTLFKTVPMQELNMLAETIGEANYYKSIGADKATQTAARQKAGRAFLGILTGNLMIGVISFLNALLKNGAKAYKDKDGELNAESVVTGMVKQYAKDAAGLALGGSEAADIMSAILFGDKWYGLETPGIEQISSIIEKTLKASKKTANMVKDSVDVLENGGDWIQYMRDHGGDYVSSVEEIGRMLATYGTGLPVDNVKAYLLGAAQHISPAIKTAYEDVVSKADKSGLKGLKGAALEMRTGHILQDRAGETSERTIETIAGLYEEGYTDAVPATIQSSYTVNGEDRKMSAAEDQLYRQVWRDSVSGTLDDLTRDKAFRNMGQADQAKVLKKLYDYGAQNAKEAVWPDYSPDKWVTTAKDLEAKDVPLSEWLPIQQELSKISGKNKKQDIKDYIDSLPYSRDQKKAMYTAEGYQDADEVNWHSGSYGGSSGRGKTYAQADLSWLERAPGQETTGLKLPSSPQARPTQSGLKLKSAPEARPVRSGLKLR